MAIPHVQISTNLRCLKAEWWNLGQKPIQSYESRVQYVSGLRIHKDLGISMMSTKLKPSTTNSPKAMHKSMKVLIRI